MRKKKIAKAPNKVKDKSAVSIDMQLAELFDKFLEGKNITNRSKYIENLIRIDMDKKGFNTEKEF